MFLNSLYSVANLDHVKSIKIRWLMHHQEYQNTKNTVTKHSESAEVNAGKRTIKHQYHWTGALLRCIRKQYRV